MAAVAGLLLDRGAGLYRRKSLFLLLAGPVGSLSRRGSVRCNGSNAVYDVVVSGGGMVGAAMAAALGMRFGNKPPLKAPRSLQESLFI